MVVGPSALLTRSVPGRTSQHERDPPRHLALDRTPTRTSATRSSPPTGSTKPACSSTRCCRRTSGLAFFEARPHGAAGRRAVQPPSLPRQRQDLRTVRLPGARPECRAASLHRRRAGGRLPGRQTSCRAVCVAFVIGSLSPDEDGLYLESAAAIWVADTLVRSPDDPSSRIGWVPDSLMDDPERTKARAAGGVQQGPVGLRVRAPAAGARAAADRQRPSRTRAAGQPGRPHRGRRVLTTSGFAGQRPARPAAMASWISAKCSASALSGGETATPRPRPRTSTPC